MDNNQLSSNLIKGTWIMAFSAVFSKILSAIYRVPLQNMVGDHGYFIYQQIYSIYGIFGVLSLTGLPLLISKILSNNNDEEIRENVRDVFWILCYISLFIVVIIQLNAKTLALMMGDIHLKEEIQLTSLIYLLMPFESLIRGYYQSKLDVKISATSQLIEQIIRVTLILIVAYLFTKGLFDVYQMGSMANFASVISAIIASGYLIIIFLKNNNFKIFLKPNFNKKIFKVILLEGLGIVFITGILVFFQMIDSLTIVSGLVKKGYSFLDAGVQKGIFDRAQPLAQLGIVIVTSFLSILVPVKQINKNNEMIIRALQFCIGLALAETLGLCLLTKPINIMLFKNAANSNVISVFLISIALYSVVNILVTMNDGNYHKKILFFIIISLIVKYILNEFLVRKIGLMGASISTNVSLVVLMIMLLFISDSMIKNVFIKNGFIIKITMSLILMAIPVFIFTKLMEHGLDSTRLNSVLITFIGIIIGVMTYGIAIFKFKVFSKKDLETIPILKRMIK